jgi:branched-chain amino acid aminotransferase
MGTEEDRLLSPLDQGFLFGASVYETIRTYDGVPFVLERHLERLRASAEALGIDIDVSRETLTERLRATLEKAGNAESSIRIVISAGIGAIDYRTGSARKPTVVIIVRPLPAFPESLYQSGAKAAFVTVMRASRGNLSPKIKSSNLLNNIMALRQAHEKGAYEALLLNGRGEVCEGSMSNVFVVRGGAVVTPPLSSGLLEGITREHVIEIARANSIELEEKTCTPEDLLGADEVFITASAREVVPIVRVDETTIGDGKPGPVTQKIMKCYQVHVHALMSTTETVD